MTDRRMTRRTFLKTGGAVVVAIGVRSVKPNRVMARVVIMLQMSFCAVPAFMRVEPATTSGPTSATISMSAARPSGEPGLQVIPTVLAPRPRAYSTAAMV